ncbi:MAG: glycosyltransferase [Acidobacteriota bacterium]
MLSSGRSGTARLSAALIVRDEERFLGDCLDSLTGVADEVVVVDTGSVDRTCDIASSRGARLLHHPWQDDFAAARNVALDACTGDWILYIDADERLTSGLPPSVRSQLEEPRIVGLTVKFRPATGFTFYREPRLFRRHEAVRFRGVIHETHLPDLYQLAARERRVIEHSELALHHLGYDGDISHKHPRNLPLLQARVRQDPGHIYSWWHLGQTLAALERHDEAETAWRQGLEVIRAAPGTSIVMCLPYLALLGHQLSHKEYFDAGLWEEALARFPGHPSLLWLKARHLVSGRRWAEAIPLLEPLVATDLEEQVARQFATEERLFRRWAPEALATSLFHLERYAEAAEIYRRLEADFPSRELAVKRQLAERRARRAAPPSPASRPW